MLFMPVSLEFQKADNIEAPGNLDLITMSGSISTLAVAACLEWESSNSTPGRDKLAQTLRESISTLIDGEKYGAHSRTHDLILETDCMFRSAEELPSGLKGLSLLVADNGDTPGTSRPHVIFTNYAGTTASYAPGYSDDFSGPNSGFVGESQEHKGLFSVSEAEINRWNGYDGIRVWADMHTLVFRNETSWSAYVGQKSALKLLARQSIASTDPIPPSVVAVHATPMA